MKLNKSFYTREDVVQVARDLLGKILVTRIQGIITSVRIMETEAYRGPDDKASHAWNNRRTRRTEVMYGEGGIAYVYLCYGIHHLFNVVTAVRDVPHAVLIRAGEPLENVGLMLERRKMDNILPRLLAGPGSLSQALGINTALTGESLLSPRSHVWLEDDGTAYKPEEIASGPRIGVDYAGECAAWPWRFWVRDSEWVSRKK